MLPSWSSIDYTCLIWSLSWTASALNLSASYYKLCCEITFILILMKSLWVAVDEIIDLSFYSVVVLHRLLLWFRFGGLEHCFVEIVAGCGLFLQNTSVLLVQFFRSLLDFFRFDLSGCHLVMRWAHLALLWFNWRWLFRLGSKHKLRLHCCCWSFDCFNFDLFRFYVDLLLSFLDWLLRLSFFELNVNDFRLDARLSKLLL